MEPQVALRPAAATDAEFLRTLFASTRERELAALPGDAAFRQMFISLQFEAQRRSHAVNHPHGDERIVEVDGAAQGRLYVDRAVDGIEIVDISLLPPCRNRGIGTRLLQDLAAEAARRGVTLGLSVAESNPAQHLYERLGFRAVGADGVYRRLVIAPAPGAGDFAAFRELVFEDPELQTILLSSADPRGFCAAVVAAGQLRGFRFDTDEVESALLQRQREWSQGSQAL